MTLADLITTEPEPDHGYPIQLDAVSGEWRFVLELADPADPYVEWLDITQFYAGDRYQRGADQPWGRFAASVAQVQLQIDRVQAEALGLDINILAPWGQDTTDLFGVDVTLDAGLLMRAGVINVADDAVLTWYPLWTGRVESWGDDSNARGQIRRHVINVVDLLADLANVPTVISLDTDDWEDYFVNEVLDGAGWLFGADVIFDAGTGEILQDLTPTAAIVRMDGGADAGGFAWRTRRNGRIIVYPAPWDTTNTTRWDTNPLLDVYPDGLQFMYEPDFGEIEYIADDDTQPFGVSRSIAGVLNTFAVSFANDPGTDPDYDVDDPVSVGRFGVRPYTATWITDNPAAVDDLLAARAYASAQALPLNTTIDHEGFFPACALIDHLDPVTVMHATLDGHSTVTVVGVVRNIVEERTVRFSGASAGSINWRTTVQMDITSTESAPALLPVEDLALVSTYTPQFGGPSGAEFSWTNPTQPDITPTQVQVRIPERSPIWVDIDYPGVGADGVSVNWLAAATSYRFQVRLIRRVNGVVTAVSPRRSIGFVTPAVIPPHPVPGEDSGDTDVIGTPPDDCEDFSVQLQESADDFTWSTIDEFTGTELELNDDGTFHLAVDIDNSVFDADKVYRFRTLCDGDVIYTGPVFDPPDDWEDPCTTPPALAVPPFDDPSLLVYVPKICAPDIIREAVGGIEAVHGDALAGFGVLADDPNYRTLIAIDDPEWSDTPGGILAYGECPQIIGETGDKSISVRVSIANAEECVLMECAGMTLSCTPTTAGWRPTVTIYKPGVTVTLPSNAILDEDIEYVIVATFELATGDLTLFIDGEADNSVGGTDDLRTINALPIWRVGAPPGSWVTDCALWNSVILVDDSPALSNVIHWYDASDTATLTPGTGVTVNAWADKVGSANMSASHSNEAALTNLGINGLEGIDFNAVSALNTRRFTANAFTALDTGTTPLVVAWVGHMKYTQGVWFDLANTSPRPFSQITGNQFVMNAGSTITDGTADQSPHVFLAVFNGASSQLYIDDSTTPAASGNAGTGDTTANAALFNVYAGGGDGRAVLGELVFATGVPSSGEITAEMDRLRHKWGIVTGGTVTYSANTEWHQFNTSGTFNPWDLAPVCDGIAVGGGGGGGGWHRGGGGGGGQPVTFSATTISTAQTVTIGAAGTGGGTGATPGPASTQGGTTSIGALASGVGGGRGGGGNDAYAAGSGGSGGGGSGVATNTPHAGAAAGAGSNVNAGGQGASADNAGGGGGGASAAGVSSATTSNGGNGYTWINGVVYGGGGGGGRFTSFGAGGTGGGGNGGGDDQNGVAGTANTGGGGGGCGNFSSVAHSGGNGGTGVAVIGIPLP